MDCTSAPLLTQVFYLIASEGYDLESPDLQYLAFKRAQMEAYILSERSSRSHRLAQAEQEARILQEQTVSCKRVGLSQIIGSGVHLICLTILQDAAERKALELTAQRDAAWEEFSGLEQDGLKAAQMVDMCDAELNSWDEKGSLKVRQEFADFENNLKKGKKRKH